MSHMATAGEHQEKQALKLSTVRQPASQRCLRAPPACLMAAPQQRLSPPQPNRHPDPQPNHHANVRA